jgi:hypothetical protein
MRAGTTLLLCVVAILSGCRPARPAAPAPAVADSALAPLALPATNLSGGWATGSDNEPPPGPVRENPTCAVNPAVWIIQQDGNALKTWEFPRSYNQGIARKDPVVRMPAIPGVISGADVRIVSDDVRLILRYDAESGHLRGTRNGAPFWAARQIVVRESCPGIP